MKPPTSMDGTPQGFARLTQKFDRCKQIRGSSFFLAQLHKEPFCNVNFNDILILLSLTWQKWRAAKNKETGSKDATWKPPESFTRNTAKFWVKMENVVKLKTMVLKHMPYLIFGASASDQEQYLSPFAVLDFDYAHPDAQPLIASFCQTMREAQLLSSIYFDCPEDCCSYRERIHRFQGARLLRFRWYEENDGSPEKPLFIERKVHHEGWVADSSTKERFILKQKDVWKFMKGKLELKPIFDALRKKGKDSEKSIKAMEGLAYEVKEMIDKKRLQPVLRTSYYRCAFQLATSNSVRVSLDTQMSLINEYMAGGHHVTHPSILIRRSRFTSLEYSQTSVPLYCTLYRRPLA